MPSTDRFERYSRLQIEQRPNGVLLITLSNPGKLNATDAGMHAGALDDLHRHPCQSRRTGGRCHW